MKKYDIVTLSLQGKNNISIDGQLNVYKKIILEVKKNVLVSALVYSFCVYCQDRPAYPGTPSTLVASAVKPTRRFLIRDGYLKGIEVSKDILKSKNLNHHLHH